MKVSTDNGVVIATAESIEDIKTLLALGKTATPKTTKKNYRSKYATEEERARARTRYARKYYRKNRLVLSERRRNARKLVVRNDSPFATAIA